MMKYSSRTVLMRILVGGRVISEVAFHPIHWNPHFLPSDNQEPDVTPYNYSAWYNHWSNRMRRYRRY